MSEVDSSPSFAVEMAAVDRSFGAVRANRGAELRVRAGEIHALVGENGAGKSTLMRVLSGMYRPDGGSVRVNGRDVTGWSTAEAIGAGVAMVHQHFMLIPTLTVAENVVLGREPTRGPALDLGRARRAVAELAAETGLEVPPGARVGDLTVGEAQRCEILKTLYRGARILILDEPTAVLSPPEVQDLWRVLRRLRDGGGTVVLITHKLDEVMDISDAVTVMRHGATVARFATAGTSPAELARAMVGRDVALAAEAVSRAPVPERGGAVLEVKDLVVAGGRGGAAVDGVSFTIPAGEILGVAGVEGNGQTELVEAIAGLRPVVSGWVRLGGRDIARAEPKVRAAAGLSHIPEDRHARGLVLDYSVGDNLILGLQDRYARLGALDRDRIRENAEEKIRGFDIRPPDRSLPARALSGGNQQKIVIAREMGRDFAALLASQPTRGVDVGAIEFIHAELRRAREAGKAVLLVSADLDEILALSDRVAVLYRGRIAALLPREDADKETVGAYMTGAGRGAA